ncbi:MAG: CAP domain-containing protein [Alphaproteobacteria bacterium]
MIRSVIRGAAGQTPGLVRMAGCLLLFCLWAAATAGHATATDAARGALREEALVLVNRDRAAHGLPPLAPDDRLSAAAQSHAADMLARNYVEHVSPEGRTPTDRYVAAGGSATHAVAENIAACEHCPPLDAGQVARLEAGWMASAGHRRNLLGAGFERFGFGVSADAAGRLYAVQMFAGPGEPRQGDDGPAPRMLGADGQLATAIDLANAARTARGLQPLSPSRALSVAARTLVARRPGTELAGVGDIPPDEVLGAVPAPERGRWRALSLLVGECGGCGREPTDADLRFFAERWLGSDAPGGLTDPEATHLGVAIGSDGEGRKTALLVIGIGR